MRLVWWFFLPIGWGAVVCACANGTAGTSCTETDTEDKCASCNTGYFLLDNVCVSNCEDATKKYGNYGVCATNCSTFLGKAMVSYNNVCVQHCPAGLYINAQTSPSTCVTACPTTRPLVDPVTQTCMAKTACLCDSGEPFADADLADDKKVCYGQTRCKKCNVNYNLVDGVCVTFCTCANGTKPGTGCSTAQDKCLDASSCNRGYRFDSSASSCIPECVCGTGPPSVDVGVCTAPLANACKAGTDFLDNATKCAVTHTLVANKCDASKCTCDNGVIGHNCVTGATSGQGCYKCNTGFEFTAKGVCTPVVVCGDASLESLNCKTPDSTVKCGTNKISKTCEVCKTSFMLNSAKLCVSEATCLCDNGVSSEDKCPTGEEQKCTSCNASFSLLDNKCYNDCKCANGTKSATGKCATASVNLCSACNSGYTLNMKNLTCDNNCVCPNGTAGTGCSTKGEVKCTGTCTTSTNFLDDGKCTTKCGCENGTPAMDCTTVADAEKKTVQTMKCASCDVGYFKSSGTCVPTKCRCPCGEAAGDCTTVELKCVSQGSGYNADCTLTGDGLKKYPCTTVKALDTLDTATDLPEGDYVDEPAQGNVCDYPGQVNEKKNSASAPTSEATLGCTGGGTKCVQGKIAKNADNAAACILQLESAAGSLFHATSDNSAFAGLKLRAGVAIETAIPELTPLLAQAKGVIIKALLVHCIAAVGAEGGNTDLDSAKVEAAKKYAATEIAGNVQTKLDAHAEWKKLEKLARAIMITNFTKRRPSLATKVQASDFDCVSFNFAKAKAYGANKGGCGSTVSTWCTDCNTLGDGSEGDVQTPGYIPLGADALTVPGISKNEIIPAEETSSNWLAHDNADFLAGNFRQEFMQKFRIDCGKAGCERKIISSVNSAIISAAQTGSDSTTGNAKLVNAFVSQFKSNLYSTSALGVLKMVTLTSSSSRRRILRRRLSTSIMTVTYEIPVTTADLVRVQSYQSLETANSAMAVAFQNLAAGVCGSASCPVVYATAEGTATLGALGGTYADEFNYWKRDGTGTPLFPAPWTRHSTAWTIFKTDWEANYQGPLTWAQWTEIHSVDKKAAKTAVMAMEASRKAEEKAAWTPAAGPSDGDSSTAVVIAVVSVSIFVVAALGYWYLNHGAAVAAK